MGAPPTPTSPTSPTTPASPPADLPVDGDLDADAVDAFLARAVAVADRLAGADHVTVLSHIDADGLASAAVATQMLDRAGVPYDLRFHKQLDGDVLADLRAEDPGLVLLVDFGSGQTPHLDGLEVAICDHHAPADPDDPGPCPDLHLNPHLVGIDGSGAISGAGCCYVVARAMDAANADLAAIAVVGAVGDLQDAKARRLSGLNRLLVEDGVEAGVLEATMDARLYGRQTRPVYKMLQYADDPRIPGVTGSYRGALALLSEAAVPLKDGDRWRAWADLDRDERRRVLSLCTERILAAGGSPAKVDRLVGEVYTLVEEEPRTPLRDAKEFATLLNSTARYGRAEVGLAVARGDRGEALDAALSLLAGHRRNLVDSLKAVRDEVRDHGVLQVFHAGDRVRETVVGIVCGMLFQDGLDRDRPIVGFANADPGKVKVSARGNRAMVARGLDLGTAMSAAAGEVGGEGGGHDVAAGATVPEGSEEAFLDAVDRVVRGQLGRE